MREKTIIYLWQKAGISRDQNFVTTNARKNQGHWRREGGIIGMFITLVSKVGLTRWLNNFGDFYLILNGWFIKLVVQRFQLLIVILWRNNFVIFHCEWTSIYRSLSYPFRVLTLTCKGGEWILTLGLTLQYILFNFECSWAVSQSKSCIALNYRQFSTNIK